jgi:hypothetical protein
MHFLDVHAGSLQVIASAVLVVVTAVYTILTRSMARAASESFRPYVYIDLLFDSPVVMIIVVGNSGTKVASNVRAPLASSNNENVAALVRALPIASGIGHLAPGSTRKYQVIVKNNDLLPANAPATMLDFEITYYNGKRKLTDRQHIDLEGYRSALVFDRDRGFSLIADRLANIERKMPSQRIVFPDAMKACPYCSSRILEGAKKCPKCLEWLSGSHRRDGPGKAGKPSRRRYII